MKIREKDGISPYIDAIPLYQPRDEPTTTALRELQEVVDRLDMNQGVSSITEKLHGIMGRVSDATLVVCDCASNFLPCLTCQGVPWRILQPVP